MFLRRQRVRVGFVYFVSRFVQTAKYKPHTLTLNFDLLLRLSEAEIK
jgi:hypothetical protein